MVKKLTATTAANQVTQAGQPAVEFKITNGEAHDPRQAPPAKKPLPAPLAKALGQS
jgi:hypothetical protein